MSVFRLAASTVVLLAAASSAHAAAPPQEIPLWPENAEVVQQGVELLSGKPWAITHPSILVYPPTAPSTRTAILVFPGGGYQVLAIGAESTIGPDGADGCRWLTDAGITCVLVKYRVPDTGCNWNPETRRHEAPAVPMARQDAQRAISLVRHRAAEFGVDADRIGVMGFSAGGNLAVLASTGFATRAYAPVDAIDRTSARPDFAIPVYPGHMTREHLNETPKAVAASRLHPDIVVSAGVPPTLLIHAEDDRVDPVHYSQVYARELRKAGVDVTLITYATGGHAFGVRKQGTASDRWTDDALAWMEKIGML